MSDKSPLNRQSFLRRMNIFPSIRCVGLHTISGKNLVLSKLVLVEISIVKVR